VSRCFGGGGGSGGGGDVRRGGGGGGGGGGFGGGGGGQTAIPSQTEHSLQRSSDLQWWGLQNGSQISGRWRCSGLASPELAVLHTAQPAQRESLLMQCTELHHFWHCRPGISTPIDTVDAAEAAAAAALAAATCGGNVLGGS
jgi:hypothetical protein